MTERIDVRKVMKLRRSVQLTSLDGLIREAERLTMLLGGEPNSTAFQEPAAAAKVRHLANMNLGQALWHIGAVMDQSRTKITFDVPWPVKIVGRMLRSRFLSNGFNMPFRHTSANDELLVPSPATTALEGLASMKEAIGDWQASERRADSPLLGRLSLADWDRLQLRHAEWHLSFMRDEQQG
jgi:hypothetical protein